MRYAMIGLGMLLLVVAALLIFQSGDTEPIKAPLTPSVMMRDADMPVTEMAALQWQAFDVKADGNSVTVHTREFPEPLPFKHVVDQFSGKGDSRLSAVGLLVMGYHERRNIKPGKEGAYQFAEMMFADAAVAQARYKEQQEKVGGWEKFTSILKRVAVEDYEQMKLLGQAVVGPSHIFIVHRRPADMMPLYIVYQREKTGLFYVAPKWSADVDTLLVNGKILELFPATKKRFPKFEGFEE